jgi:hypothetical protein
MTTKKIGKHNLLNDSNFRLMAMGVALLCLTLSAFVTTTLTWFDISDNLIVNNMSFHFDDDDTFKIGLKKSDTIDYFQKLDSATLASYVPTYSQETPLATVTSAFQEDWLSSIQDPTTAEPLFLAGPTSRALAEGGFYQFDFYFLSSHDAYIYLDQATSLNAAKSENLKIAERKNLNAEKLNRIEHCARISFYNAEMGYKIYEPNAETASTTLLGGRLDIAPRDGYFDYGSDKKELIYGDYNQDATLYYGDAAAVSSIEGEDSCFNALTSEGVQALDIDKSEKEGGLQIKREETYLLSDLIHDPDSNELGHPLAYAPMGVPTKVVVSVYIEGWDLDTIESVASASFNLSINFSAYLRSREA